jgi:polar amino acid transport system substrate-binding protein
MTPELVAELAPTGTLRAAINLSNFLLVSGRGPAGEPQGVAPDMARAVADALGVPLRYITFPKPGELADAVADWDIGLIGAEPQRAERIAFSAAYAEIAATYLVPAGSPITALAEIDRPGVRIAVNARSAYDLWLSRNLAQASLHRAEGLEGAVRLFTEQRLDALAGLLPALLGDRERLPGSRILEGNFTTVQQAIGTPRNRTRAAAFLAEFVETAKASGLVARLIERHHIQGLSVAPAAR